MFLGTKLRTGQCYDYFSHEQSLSENALSEVQRVFVYRQTQVQPCLFVSFTSCKSKETVTISFFEGKWINTFWSNGLVVKVAGFPIQGSQVQNHWVAPRSVQSFIFPRSIKWVPGYPGNQVVKVNCLLVKAL